ncbi:Latent-transforming growth factor beta-binding protein 4 [Larimichthys crocea]|uniref:Latent-transforming growth factor beta-binding protein 4 n=2 Tax=Larimichthys crocea TaxID=215358 RepID=A0A6G0ITK2_LARCR|nr:Latent-transforming growth factor beta-binding protein 4 [Larimichthys crocea]
MSVCWQHITADLVCQSPLAGPQFTFMDCCCMHGEGWGLQCLLCPSADSDDYATLCSSGGPPYFPPYTSESFPDDYSPAGDDRSGFRGRGPVTFSLPDASPPRSPSFRLPPDPRAERAFGARPLPPSRPYDGPLTLPGAPYLDQEEEEEEEVAFRPGPPFPPFTERSRGGGGGAPRRVYERRYESYAGLSTAEDCGILHGCENGRCIRVAEGYTCDCYQGYGLDMTSMTCIDKNECEDGVGVEYPCVNARCVNTEGSFRCVCRRGYVMSRRPNHCVAA